ncbi:hypothetical protein EMEDMD4_790220 [Sinorhizobium medicae]|uniref:Uncharacterized protein n=1 Tax=Sinorhizobium medicae TaxID=110321 RepID=A0A508XAT8_9HYPH|nr:hypothetical protein EMEDMD4_790220 [Sinorhizobium medicae]
MFQPCRYGQAVSDGGYEIFDLAKPDTRACLRLPGGNRICVFQRQRGADPTSFIGYAVCSIDLDLS